MERRIYRVSQVNRYVKSLLAQDRIVSDLWVSGEISNCKWHSSGHIYFTLKDEEGAIAAVMFASDTRTLAFRPSEGMKVEVRGYVSLYEKTGQYQLYVRRMEPAGEGALYQAFLELKSRLEKEGLFDPSHKKPIPKYARTIGLVTSPTGAAVRDMIQIAKRRYPGVSILLCPVLVQGAFAARSISDGIRRMNEQGEAEVLIVGRGGGSIEDLWAFNEEETARAIYQSKIPVVSAVGHETDFTIADFVSDLRAPTPSAAAELAVPPALEVQARLAEYGHELARKILLAVQHKRRTLQYQTGAPALRLVRMRLDQDRQTLDLLRQTLMTRTRYRHDAQGRTVKALTDQLALLNPMLPLTRGYSILTDSRGVVASVERAVPGSRITARLRDGTIALLYEKKGAGQDAEDDI